MKIDNIINTIINADCLDVLQKMPDNCIDLVITSPPYDDLRTYHGYSFNFENIAKELFRVMVDGGVVVWVVGDQCIDGQESGTSFKQVLFFKDIGFNLHDTMIYQKTGFAFPSVGRYHQVFEFMFVLSKGTPKTFNAIKDRKNIETKMGGDAKRQRDGSVVSGKRGGSPQERYGMRFNIWKYKTGGGLMSTFKLASQHPATFPENLAKDHILSWSNKNDLVMDIFSGSGTTIAMAERLNRRWIGIDISESYCEIARKRIEKEKLDKINSFGIIT